jgi:hypothetical protein
MLSLDGRSRLKSQRRIPEPLYASMVLLWGILTLGLGIRWPWLLTVANRLQRLS